MPTSFSTWFNLNDCVEKSFFKTVIIITLAACLAVVVIDIAALGKTMTHAHLTALCIFVLLIILYSVNKVSFQKLTLIGLLALCFLFTYRSHISDNFNHVTYTILITIGFINALVGKRPSSKYSITIIFLCLLSVLFKDIDKLSFAMLVRMSIPYLCVFFIVTVCSSFLKRKYESNQTRLKEMVELLNQKNRKINEQNVLLNRKFSELEELNCNLENIIIEKTRTIIDKNKQLADIAYANAHTIRGPLARILGLLNLMEVDSKQKDVYASKLHKEAVQMDEILLVVTKQIEANIHK